MIFSAMILSAGSLSLSAQQFIFKTYTFEDGLVSNPVRRIFQDKKGFIWIGTWEGLSKYDGYKFTNYTIANGLSHNMVNDLYESPDEKLYVAENNGTVDVLLRDVIDKKAAFHNAVINQFYQTQNNRVIAVTDTNGVFEIKNGALVKPPQSFPGSTYNVLTELDDSLLIGGSASSLHILNERLELLSEIKQPSGILTLKIYKDSRSRLWIGTNNGLKLLSPVGKDNQYFQFAVLPAAFNIPVLKNTSVNDMLEDSHGNFWIATTNGLVKIYAEGSWQLFSENDGLPSANISCIYQDKEKNMWIGTLLGLAKLVAKNDISIYPMKKELNVAAGNFLLALKNDLFLTGSGTGIQLYNNRDGVYSPIKSPHNFTGFVQNSSPRLFYGDNNRIGRYDSVNRFIIDYISPTSLATPVYCSTMDTNGVIFNGTYMGLFISRDKKFLFEKNLPYRITCLLIDKKGDLWIGTWDNGLYKIHYTNIKNEIHLDIKNISELVPDKNIRYLFEDSKGNIWIGTRYEGLIQVINNKQFTARQFGLSQGLMSNWILTIAEDAKGNIWVGSNLGIEKLIPTDRSFRVFNFSRVNNYFANIGVILPMEDHSFWFASNKSLVSIVDEETEKNPPLPVYITSIDLGDTSFNYGKYDANKKVQLKHFQNYAAFEFSAPGFVNEKQILYAYRLLGGTDTAWSTASNHHDVSYNSLQPGNYNFEVRTLGWNGEWGATANFLFGIRPPFWQTWWFYSLIGLTILSLFYALYLYRIRQLLNLQKVRNRIATDLHDDIGATLTNINMLSEISRKNLEQPKEAEKFLYRITEEVTSTSQALNDIIWSVNSRNDSMEEILLRMRRYAAELFDNSKTIFHLDIDETVAGKKINMEQRRDVYLVYKESMNNILKHASANNVWIDVQLQNGKLSLRIKDDGKGFESAVVTNRNGLRNIHFRTEKWKGTTLIKTSPGNGTLIEIMWPVSG